MNLNWDSLADFLDMGGYALYVWGSYVMVALTLAWEAAVLIMRRRRAIDDLGLQAAQDIEP